MKDGGFDKPTVAEGPEKLFFIDFLLLLVFSLLYLIVLCFPTVLTFVSRGFGGGFDWWNAVVRKIEGTESFVSFRNLDCNLIDFLACSCSFFAVSHKSVRYVIFASISLLSVFV